MTADARAEAVDLGAKAIADKWGLHPSDEEGWDSAVSTATAAYDAWFSPRTGPCSECGGTGSKWEISTYGEAGRDWDLQVLKHCPAGCDHGQVSSPPLAVLMGELEQADSVQVNVHSEWGQVTVEELDAAETLFRLRSGESSP